MAVVAAKVDDVVDAFAVHGACGFWGVVAVGIFCTPSYTYNLNGYYGLIFGDPMLLVLCFIGLACQIVWVATTSAVLFGALKVANLLRIPPEVEEEGADASEHGGSAYTSDSAPTKAPASPPPPEPSTSSQVLPFDGNVNSEA